MVEWHHRLNGHGFGWTPGVGDAAVHGEQFTNNAALNNTHGYSASSSETSVVGGGSSGGGGGEVVVGGASKFDVTFAPSPVAPASGTQSTPAFGPGGTQPSELNPTIQNFGGEAPQNLQRGTAPPLGSGEETIQTAGEQWSQGAEERITQDAVDRTTQRPAEEVGQSFESETIITTDEDGVQHIIITGQYDEATQQVASAPRRTFSSEEENPEVSQEEDRKTTAGLGRVCSSDLSVRGSHDPDPVLIGGRITFTLTFVNTSGDESFKNVTLRNILPEGMTFVSASNDAVEVGNVVTWRLGGLQPGEKGTRSLVAQTNFVDTGGAFLTNNNAYLEDGEGRCARTRTSITVLPVSLGDNDNDSFPNADEIRCGSDPKDPASTCYSLDLLEEDRTVKRGSGMTFTVMLRRNFNYEGEVSFNTPNSIPGVLWTFSRLSAELTPADEMVSFPFTITTTATTPLGRHRIRIQANSGGMTSEKILVLDVVP